MLKGQNLEMVEGETNGARREADLLQVIWQLPHQMSRVSSVDPKFDHFLCLLKPPVGVPYQCSTRLIYFEKLYSSGDFSFVVSIVKSRPKYVLRIRNNRHDFFKTIY